MPGMPLRRHAGGVKEEESAVQHVETTLDRKPGERRRPRGSRVTTVSPWVLFVVRRLLSLVVVLFGILVIVFSLVRLAPVDPALAILGENATTERIEQVHAQLGLDGTLLEQFQSYLSGLVQGDLGVSFSRSVDVSTIIAQRIGTSAELAFGAIVVVLLIGIPLGILAGAATQGGRAKRFEAGFVGVTSLLYAIPEVFIAILLVLVFAIQLSLLPAGGVGGFEHMILPILAVAVGPTALLGRIVRVETVNVLSQDYIRMARSQRLHQRTIFLRHVLPNVLTASMTIAGLLFASIIGGAVVIESVFNLPGLGTALVEAVKVSDYPLSTGIILVLGATVVVVNMVVDIAIAIADPRSLARHA